MNCGFCNRRIDDGEPTAIYGADFIPVTLHDRCHGQLVGGIAAVRADDSFRSGKQVLDLTIGFRDAS